MGSTDSDMVYFACMSENESTTCNTVRMLQNVLRDRNDIHVALLFGSRARNTAQSRSDVDLAVVAPGVDLLQLAATIERALHAKVDVISLSRVTIPLLNEIINDAIVVHEGVAGAAASWRSSALAMLATDLPWYERMRDAWLKRVAEQGLQRG